MKTSTEMTSAKDAAASLLERIRPAVKLWTIQQSQSVLKCQRGELPAHYLLALEEDEKRSLAILDELDAAIASQPADGASVAAGYERAAQHIEHAASRLTMPIGATELRMLAGDIRALASQPQAAERDNFAAQLDVQLQAAGQNQVKQVFELTASANIGVNIIPPDARQAAGKDAQNAAPQVEGKSERHESRHLPGHQSEDRPPAVAAPDAGAVALADELEAMRPTKQWEDEEEYTLTSGDMGRIIKILRTQDAGEPTAWRCDWSNWRQYHDDTDPLPSKWDGRVPTITPLYLRSQPAREAVDVLACGVSRREWHDKAWGLFHGKTFVDTQLSKVNMHTIRTVFDATYDALRGAGERGS